MPYSPNEIARIVQEIQGPVPILYLPCAIDITTRRTGARFIVAPSRNDIEPATETELWDLLHRLPMPAAIVALSSLNLVITRVGFDDPTHHEVNRRYLWPHRRQQVFDRYKADKQPPAALRVFSRSSVLLAEKLLVMLAPKAGNNSEPVQLLGELALLINDYAGGSYFRQNTEAAPDWLKMVVELLSSWDINNSADLAYGVTRAHRIFRVHLLAADPAVQRLRDRVGIRFEDLQIDGIPLEDYIGFVFGLHAWHLTLDLQALARGEKNCAMNFRNVFERTRYPEEYILKFFEQRSRSLEEFAKAFGPPPQSPAALNAKLASDVFVGDFMKLRQCPFVRLSDTHVVCLDIRLLTDLLVYGVYWRILDQLPCKAQGDSFIELWGHLFERYCAELLTYHYPPLSGLLRLDVKYASGQIDALLDLGDDIIIIELKGSLFSVAAKYQRNSDTFEKEFRSKYIENERGEPKALHQLSTACQAAVSRQFDLASKPKRIYPVLVGYESNLESFGLNRYAHEDFKQYVPSDIAGRVRPLTVMSIEALEHLLAFTSAGDFTWPSILEDRFKDGRVVGHSVCQTIDDWRTAANAPRRHNNFLWSHFLALFDAATHLYRDSGGSTG